VRALYEQRLAEQRAAHSREARLPKPYAAQLTCM